PLDSVAIVRVAPPAPEEITVYATEFGSGVGSFIDRNVIGGRSYRYRLTASTTTGGEYRSGDVSATVPVFANQLAQNAPNPFNPATTIVYSLSQRASVAVSIFDVTGVPIRRIEQGVRDAGEYAVEWDGRDDAGIVVGTGVYFYRLDGVTGVTPKKMVLLK
ncbi:MAG TPA: FlgD immunoglobulin-like domain containing protein, partial [Candidatus Krumholzibacteria bacterium]|nr:FlgD immunoglobulin-like domain containing protein [Candidatus Krumholzibacteria bacterium]